MIKKIVFLFSFISASYFVNAQVLYSERFNAQPLTPITESPGQQSAYSVVPSTMVSINSNNVIADTLTGNFPFRVAAQKQNAWLTYNKASVLADTFAVSTSWLLPAGASDAWLITPIIANITSSTVVNWEALSADASHLDGYEVYVSTNTSTNPVISDFTSNKIASVAAENYIWTKRGVSLAAFSGQDIRIAFRHNTSNQYQLWLDDIIVENTANLVDAEAVNYNTYKYSTINTNNVISASYKNNGYVPIASLTLNYKVGTNVPVTETQSFSTPINYNETRVVNFNTPYISSTASYNDVKVWISLINGQANTINSNDTVYGSLTLASASNIKKVLLEETTSAREGWCPDGFTKLQSIATNTNVVIVCNHINDSMQTVSGMALSATSLLTPPYATIDQYVFNDKTTAEYTPLLWSSAISQKMQLPTPVSVSLTAVHTASTSQITALLSVNFKAEVKGDFRVNVYMKENNVYGPINDNTNNDWNQLSFMQSVPTSPYYALGSVLNASTTILNASEFKHQFVLDSLLDGTFGDAGVINTTTSTLNQTYSKSYAITLPTAPSNVFRYNADNIYLVAVVSEYNVDPKKREVLNVCETKLTTNPETLVGIHEFKKQNVVVSMYPNPASSYFVVNTFTNNHYDVTITNVFGDVVLVKNNSSNSEKIETSHLPSGNYFVTVSSSDFSITKKIIIIK